MRNWKQMMKAFVGIAAVSGLCACEEADPAPKMKPQPVVEKVAPAPTVTPPIASPPVVAQATEEPATPAEPEIADGDKKVDVLLRESRQAVESGELDRAEKLLHLAQLKAPHRASVWNTLGRVQLKKGERKAAITSFEKAVEENPRSSFAHNNLGLALIYEGRYDDAVDALEEATELEPVEPYMWNNLGMAYEHLDRLEEARDAYSKAVELSNGRAGTNLARLKGVKSVRTARAEVEKSDVDLPAMSEGVDGGTH
jgi:Flp pilus assembly protein TadD